jgi:UrcA family protein
MSTSLTARVAGPRAKFGLLLLGSLAGIMAAGGAGAARLDSDELPSVVVKYSEQSLATDEGVSALYRRITSAAKRVCPDAPIGDLGLRAEVEHCRNQAIARAVQQVDNSRLAALHAAHSKNG